MTRRAPQLGAAARRQWWRRTRDPQDATHPRNALRCLALPAAENNTTIRNLVEALAESRPTQSEFEERAAQARAELASILGTVPSAEAETKARGLLERLGATQDSAAA